MMNNEERAIWNNSGRPVKNHLCDGLRKFQSRRDDEHNTSDTWDYNCIPVFDGDGSCDGCDATNYNKIQFCPFCGIKLE